jgi:hypothetical protein
MLPTLPVRRVQCACVAKLPDVAISAVRERAPGAATARKALLPPPGTVSGGYRIYGPKLHVDRADVMPVPIAARAGAGVHRVCCECACARVCVDVVV